MTSRQHVNEHGRVKRAWPTYVQAKRFADALPIVGLASHPLDAYCCNVCHRWHVGQALRRSNLARHELGTRACIGIRQENTGKRSKRAYQIRRRCAAAVRLGVAA